MKRLTTDNPQNNFQTMMNYAYAKDDTVHLAYGNGIEGIDLCEYIHRVAGCDSAGTQKDILDGSCMECDCNFAILYRVATQAAELRARLKAIEDILGDDYDLDSLRKAVAAEKNPVSEGTWLYEGNTAFGYTFWKCSNCRRKIILRPDESIVAGYPYCNCGTKMGVGQNVNT